MSTKSRTCTKLYSTNIECTQFQFEDGVLCFLAPFILFFWYPVVAFYSLQLRTISIFLTVEFQKTHILPPTVSLRLPTPQNPLLLVGQPFKGLSGHQALGTPWCLRPTLPMSSSRSYTFFKLTVRDGLMKDSEISETNVEV